MSGPAPEAPSGLAAELAAAAATLYGSRPEDFVAARGALVKELRAAKARDAAREVATWRRPSVADWGLNQVARQVDSPLPVFLAAAATARDAQAGALEGRGGAGALRAAVAELRGASEAVIRAADAALASEGRAAGSQLSALATRLTEVAATEELAEQLRAGCLGAGSVTIVDLFGGEAAPVADRAAPARRAGPKTPPARATTPTKGPRAGSKPPEAAPTATPTNMESEEAERKTRRRALQDVIEAAENRHRAEETDRAGAVACAEAARAAVTAARAHHEEVSAVLAAAEVRLREAETEEAAAAVAAGEAGAASQQSGEALVAARTGLEEFDREG